MAERQGEGEITKGLGGPILDLLEARRGVATLVRLHDGEGLLVYNAAWGRDMGDLWEHITTNCSPSVEGRPIDYFLTSQVFSISDPTSGVVLFEQEPHPDET